MDVLERFLNYISIPTASVRNQKTIPSSMCQFDLAHQLVYELRQLGLSDAMVTNHCYVYAHLPATEGFEELLPIGFICHLDTYPDCSGIGIQPQIIPDYNGEDVPLGASGITLRAEEFPDLPRLRGQTLITSDGTTLLGVDDKGGIAAVITALECLVSENAPHGPISIAFMPDEELGTGTKQFDYERFGAKAAYTVDGWKIGEIMNESFYATRARVRFKGQTCHTGQAKGIMVNAQLLAMEFYQLLPQDEIPSKTEGREGFFHLRHSEGDITEASATYMLRDFDLAGMERRKDLMKQAAESMNRKWGVGTVELLFHEEYRNMKGKLEGHPWIIENAARACRTIGIVPDIGPARGGTDGAVLSWGGLPCPNLGVGGWGYHSVKEHTTRENLEITTKWLLEIMKLPANTRS